MTESPLLPDLSAEVTVFVSTVGAASFPDCMTHLAAQDCRFGVEVIEGVAPMSAAFQSMLDRCTTPFYVQVDEDMILRPSAVRRLHQRMKASADDVALVVGWLWDVHLGRAIQGVKIFRHSIVARYPYADFPATLSLICQDVVLDQIEHGGRNAARILAAYRRGMTQLASHGFIHPFSWTTETFDADREIAGAKAFLERWSGEELKVFLYTGDCALSAGQLWQVASENLLGVNGQARFQQPMLRAVGDWFQFLAAGASDFDVEDYPRYCTQHFERILNGELDYPISVYAHHYAMMTRERADKMVIVLEWLRAHADRLHFDSLENYYGEWHSRIVPVSAR
jgi:hypothetical protein